MRNRVIAIVVALSLVGSTGCALFQAKTPPSQIQIVAAEADAVDAANQLGELVSQLQNVSHKLHQAGVIDAATDNTVQTAAITFANGKDQAVKNIGQAQTVVAVLVAVAPLVSQASTIVNVVGKFVGSKASGAAGVLIGQIPDLLSKAKTLVGKLS